MALKGEGKTKRNSTGSGFKGVAKSGCRFRAKIGYGREQLHLGVYDSAAEAAYAYNYACTMLNPGQAAPNPISAAQLSARKRGSVVENVMRLLHPRRMPRQKSAT